MDEHVLIITPPPSFFTQIAAALGFHESTTDAVKGVTAKTVPYLGGDGVANVNAALAWARTVFFKTSNGDRSSIQNVVVLFVVGKVSSDGDSATSAAAILKNPPTSAKILTIGIEADDSELEAIASSPDDDVRNPKIARILIV